MKKYMALAFASLLLLAFSTSAFAFAARANPGTEEPLPFLLKWGTRGTEDGQFKMPRNAAVDANNNIYVADGYNHRIQKFTSNGSFEAEFGDYGRGDGQFNVPMGVAVDPSGLTVYVADTNNFRIQKWTSVDSINYTFQGWWGRGKADTTYYSGRWWAFGSGKQGAAGGKTTENPLEFRQPRDVVIGPSGQYIYVADTGNWRIQKIDVNTNSCLIWFGGTYYDPAYNPMGLGIDSSGQYVYAANYHRDRVDKFDSSNGTHTYWGSSGTGDGEFKKPMDVAVDSSGQKVYVVEYYGARVQKFDSVGTYLTKWGSYGGDPGQFRQPEGVAVDSDDNVYVGDTGNNRIQKFGSVSHCESITSNEEVNEACCVKDGIYIDPTMATAIKGTYEGDLTAEIDPTKATHGSYVSCVAHKVNELRRLGLISANEGGEIVRAAGQSDVNKPTGSIH